tara:strand:- start:684 stop:923 length:240 start_codon:yes stop_codon:yes gene_type:complete
MSEEMIDKASAWILGIAVLAAVYMMFFVYAPAREKLLFETHDCFVERGCEASYDYNSPEFNRCWNTCETEVVDAWSASR